MHTLQCEENAKPQTRNLILTKPRGEVSVIFLILRIFSRARAAHVGRLGSGLANSRENEVQRATLMEFNDYSHVFMDGQSGVSCYASCIVAL